MLRVVEYFVKSLKIIRTDTLEFGACKSLLVFRCNYVCISDRLRYSASNNDVTLKSGSGVVQRHWSSDTVSYSHSINYGCILNHYRDNARCWPKIAIFNTHVAFDAPPPAPLGGPRRNIVLPLGTEKLECYGYPIIKKNFIICLVISTQ